MVNFGNRLHPNNPLSRRSSRNQRPSSNLEGAWAKSALHQRMEVLPRNTSVSGAKLINRVSASQIFNAVTNSSIERVRAIRDRKYRDDRCCFGMESDATTGRVVRPSADCDFGFRLLHESSLLVVRRMRVRGMRVSQNLVSRLQHAHAFDAERIIIVKLFLA